MDLKGPESIIFYNNFFVFFKCFVRVTLSSLIDSMNFAKHKFFDIEFPFYFKICLKNNRSLRAARLRTLMLFARLNTRNARAHSTTIEHLVIDIGKKQKVTFKRA